MLHSCQPSSSRDILHPCHLRCCLVQWGQQPTSCQPGSQSGALSVPRGRSEAELLPRRPSPLQKPSAAPSPNTPPLAQQASPSGAPTSTSPAEPEVRPPSMPQDAHGLSPGTMAESWEVARESQSALRRTVCPTGLSDSGAVAAACGQDHRLPAASGAYPADFRQCPGLPVCAMLALHSTHRFTSCELESVFTL